METKDKYRKMQGISTQFLLLHKAVLPFVLVLIATVFTIKTQAQTLGNEYSGWKSNTTFVVKVRSDENSKRIDEFHLKVGGATIALITDDDDNARSGMTYINLEDFNGHDYDGFYNEDYGTFSFTKKSVSNDEAYWTIEWTVEGLTDNSAVSLTFEHKWCDDGGSNPGSKTNSLSTFYSAAMPEAANVNIQADPGSSTITWDAPSIPAGIEGSFTFETIIKKDGTEVGTVGITETTFTNNEEGGKYEVLHKAKYNNPTMSYSWELVGSAGGGTAPELPRVDKPVGVKASKGRCDGIILLSWDYNGKYAPETFTIDPGGITVAGDIREYEFAVGDHQTGSYTVTAVGTINTSDPSSAAEGNTFGVPSIPAGFNASISGNTINLSWGNATNENKYLIKRTSPDEELEFEISADQTSYTDNKVAGCVGYTYQLYAANRCTADEGLAGIKAATEPWMRIEPNLASYITFFDASKAYFPDKVMLEWSVQSNNYETVDKFEIYRSVAADNDYKFLTTIEKAATYDDKSAIGGVMYKYRIQGILQCENDIRNSNQVFEAGFRLPYGIVTGHVEYETGVAVENVELLAEKPSGATGKSVQFGGGSQISVPNKASLNPSAEIMVEAWVRPTSGTGTLVDKGNYRLYLSGNTAYFTIPSLGANQTVQADVSTYIASGYWFSLVGTYDGDSLRIFVNGRVPYDTKYVLRSNDLTTLQTMKLPSDVIAALSTLVDIEYNDPNPNVAADNLYAALETKIGVVQTELYSKFIMPLAKVETQKPTAIKDAFGMIASNANPIIIGAGYAGLIDEIRLWNKAKTPDMVGYDHKRMLAKDEANIIAYWRCDEGFGDELYDCSKTGNDHNRNDGLHSAGNITFSVDIAAAEQLGWAGVTDDKGNYLIPYMPYYANGEIFTVTPRYGGATPHEFSPPQKSVFIGEGANIISDINFIDLSSFKVTGTVVFEDFMCGVEGVMLYIDGAPVVKDYDFIYTDEQGKFEITVPVGLHYVEVRKNGHTFKSATFPPTGRYNFQDQVIGINFIDQTRIKVVGRVVGGTAEGDKEPGLGLSKNNIGVAEWSFKSAQGFGCAVYPITTDVETGEYTVEMHPMQYMIDGFTVPHNLDVDVYFNNIFPKADFSLMVPEKTSEYETPNVEEGTITIDRVANSATIELLGNTEVVDATINESASISTADFFYKNIHYRYALDKLPDNITIVTQKFEVESQALSTTYHYRYDLIYRSAAQMFISEKDGVSSFIGDKEIMVEDKKIMKPRSFNVEQHPLLYPVISQGNKYEMLIAVDEVYYNFDQCPPNTHCSDEVMDRVAVEDGEIEIHNECASLIDPEPLTLTNGKVLYWFYGGSPNVLLSPAPYEYRSFSKVMNISYTVNNNGIEWKPNATEPIEADQYFRAYVLGKNSISGSDFVTKGPQVVETILRDPPGSESFASISKGTTITNTKTWNFSGGTAHSFGASWDFGTYMVTGTGGGLAGPIVLNSSTGSSAGFDINTSLKTTWGRNGEQSTSQTYNQTIQTSSSPELAGAPSDIFMGASYNFLVNLADNVDVFENDFATNTSLVTSGIVADDGVKQIIIGMNRSLLMTPDSFQTYFMYTQDHIENYLVPSLINLRNKLFIQKPDKYVSNITAAHDLFGANNDDPRWTIYGETPSTQNPILTEVPDYDGPSYTFAFDEEKPENDMVRWYNQQIKLWQEQLAKNEAEKFQAKLLKNISFDAGPTFEYSETLSETKQSTTTFELNFDFSIDANTDVKVFGSEFNISRGFQVDLNTSSANSLETSVENTYGYVLHDPDQGDYFSVDVKDPQTGTSPVFAIQGGRSMCPHEGPQNLKYYKPQSLTITEAEVIPQLFSLGINSKLLAVLRWANTNRVTINEIKTYFGSALEIDATLLAAIGDEKLRLPQILERQFNSEFYLRDAVYSIIDMNIDTESEEIEIDPDAISEAADAEALEENWGTNTNGSVVFFLFPQKTREELKAEFELFIDHIRLYAGKGMKGDDELQKGTIRREVPTASVYPDVRYNIPDDNLAYFDAQFGNNSYSGDAMWYELRVLPESNPDGAVVSIDGDPINGQVYEIAPGQFINKTISVAQGKTTVFDYENLKVAIYSPCEWAFHTNGRSMADEAIDTISFSVHFVPSCTDIDVFKPGNGFVVNYTDQTLLDGVKKTYFPIVMSGYEQGFPLENIAFEFKFLTEENWIEEDKFHTTPDPLDTEQKPIDGRFQGLEWNLSGYPDGKYSIRAHSFCGRDPLTNEAIFDLSEEWIGTVDRKPPKLFGTPSPADGILQPNDEIFIKFNEDIFGEKLFHLANFDVRGVLNGSELRHAASVGFNGVASDYVRIPEGIILTDKQFTVEFWAKRTATFSEQCIISQGSNPANSLYIGFDAANNAVFHVGDKTITTHAYPVPNPYLADPNLDPYEGMDWHHWAFVYDIVLKKALIYIDGKLVSMQAMDAQFESYGPIVIGKRLYEPVTPFNGKLHELRVWSRARTASQLSANMLITLSGKERGMLGYWQLNECQKNLAMEKVRKLHARVNAPWKVEPEGYAAKFDGTSASIDMKAPALAFNEEENFTLEFWFKGGAENDGKEVCLFSNGKGDGTDATIYQLNPTDLFYLERTLPLSTISTPLKAMENEVYADETLFFNRIYDILSTADDLHATKYREQLIRYGKKPTTYWSVNTDKQGNIYINNNGQAMKIVRDVVDPAIEKTNWFDDKWHHLALVVERAGNTRVFIDSELLGSKESDKWNGFGAALMTLGCRSWYEIVGASAGFQKNQFFNGEIDEFRVWNKVRKQEQIDKEMSSRLRGDEFGLAAYVPFEEYEEVMGIPIMTEKLYDVMSPESTDLQLSGIIDLQQEDQPTIKLHRPVSKVDYDYTFDERQIIFTLKDPPARIENCILDFTVKGVEDMFGNKLSSPVTWSAFIDMNQMKWNTERLEFDKLEYAPLSFTAEIINSSGQQQHFSIENLPSWLKAEPREGDLEPLKTQTVTFTVNAGLNVGYYNDDILLQTDFEFDEKLNLNLRVYRPAPVAWQYNPNNFQYSMSMIGQLQIGNVISIDKYDMLGAFVDGECRGYAYLEYIEEYDMYEVYLTVFSNEITENFELRIWDASEGVEFSQVVVSATAPATRVLPSAAIPYQKQFVFTNNEMYGFPSDPLTIQTEGLIRQVIPLAKGWNWVSFNLDIDYTKPLAVQLKGLEERVGDIIKTETKYTQFTPPIGWNGTLKELGNNEMFMFYVSQADTLEVQGEAVNVNDIPVNIHQNWNRISYLPQENMTVADAFASFRPNHGAVVKNQFSFAMFDRYMGWLGSLKYMKPNEGYMLYYNNSSTFLPATQSFYYPKTGSLSKGLIVNNEELIMNNEEWGTVYRANALNMTILAEVQNMNIATDDILGVFAENECVGYGTPVTMADGRKLFFIVANTDQNMSQLTFKLASGASSTLQGGGQISFNETTAFAANEMTGTLENPFILNANSEVTSGVSQQFNNSTMQQCNVFPNPFTSKTNFEIYLENQCDIQIEIFDVTGRKVDAIQRSNVANGKHIVEWEGSRFANGVYSARITVGNELFTVKLVKTE